MRIELVKFGTMLLGREAGREALLVLRPRLDALKSDEMIEADFSGVAVFTPSWGDEVLGNLLDVYDSRLITLHTENPSVHTSLDIIEQVHGKKFIRK